MKKVLWISVCFLLAFAFLSAKGIGGAETKTKAWTCSMHPEVALPKPGKCPTCSMDLVPAQFAKNEELGKLRTELRVVLKKIAEQGKMLHGEAAGREMAKLLMEEMKGVTKETGIGMAGCCPMNKEMMENCKKKDTCPMMKKGSWCKQ